VLTSCCPDMVGVAEFAEGTTPEEAVRTLGIPHGSQWIALVNGRPGGAGSELVDGDRLYVFVPASGG